MRRSVGRDAERLPELAREQLRAVLLDRHKSMREVGRFYLSKIGESDFGEFYVLHLNDVDEHLRAAAMAGLGEVGKGEGLRSVDWFFWGSELVGEASGGARGGAVGCGQRFFDQLMGMVEDKKSGVARAGRDAVASRPDLLEPKRLWGMFEEGRQPHVCKLVLSLIGKLQWWESARLLVLATGCGDASSKAKAIDLLELWEKSIPAG